MDDLRYPIGRFDRTLPITPERITTWVGDIAALPAQVRSAVSGLTDAQLETTYRPEGWTVRQLVHHLADSHMNAFIRFKLGLTEEAPTIKPYDESEWAAQADSNSPPIDASLAILDGLHARWIVLLKRLTPEQFARTIMHPEAGVLRLDFIVGLYAWHGKHHTTHITSLRERMGW